MTPVLRSVAAPAPPVVRAAADPRLALCRSFCRHFVRMTGTGLAAASTARAMNKTKDEGK